MNPPEAESYQTARVESPPASGRRRVPRGRVAPPSSTPGIPGRRRTFTTGCELGWAQHVRHSDELPPSRGTPLAGDLFRSDRPRFHVLISHDVHGNDLPPIEQALAQQSDRPRGSRRSVRVATAIPFGRSVRPENCAVLDCVRGRRVGLPRNVGLRHAEGGAADTRHRRSAWRVLHQDRRRPACAPGPAIVAVGRTRHTWTFQAGGQGPARHRHNHASRLRHGAGCGHQGRLPERLPDRDISGPAAERQPALPGSSRLHRSDQGQSGHPRLPSFPFTAVPLQAGAGGAAFRSTSSSRSG